MIIFLWENTWIGIFGILDLSGSYTTTTKCEKIQKILSQNSWNFSTNLSIVVELKAGYQLAQWPKLEKFNQPSLRDLV